MKRSLQRLVKLCLAVIVGLVLLLLCSDLWLPRVLPAIATHFRVQVHSVDSIGSGQWELAGFSYVSGGVDVSASKLQVPSFRSYLWHCLQGDAPDELLVKIDELCCVIQPSASSDVRGGFDPAVFMHTFRKQLDEAGVWIPSVSIELLSIRSEEELLLESRGLSYRAGVLETELSVQQFVAPVRLAADMTRAEMWTLELAADEQALSASVTVDFEQPESVGLQGSVVHGEELLAVDVVLDVGRTLPATFNVQSSAFTIQMNWFPQWTQQYSGTFVVSELDCAFSEGAYRGHVNVVSEFPVADAEVVPFSADISFSGDTDSLSVNRCELSGAWGELLLSSSLTINLVDRMVHSRAELTAKIDLSEQPWIPAEGRLSGRLSVAPNVHEALDLNFELQGEGLSYTNYEAEAVSMSGRMLGSVITLEKLQLDLIEGTEADRVSLFGSVDVNERSLDLVYDASLGADWLNELIGADYFSDELVSSGRIFGPLAQPKLEAELEPVTLNHPLLHPIRIEGLVRSMSGAALDVDLIAECRGAAVQVDVFAERKGEVCSVEVRKLLLMDPGLPDVSLVQPSRITYRTTAELSERLSVEPFQLEGSGSSFHVNWNAAEGFKLVLGNIVSSRIDRWVRKEIPMHRIEELSVKLTQLKPKILGSVDVRAEVDAIGDAVLRLDLVSRIMPKGIVFEELAVGFQGQPLLTGDLALPIRLQLPSEEVPLIEPVAGGYLSGALSGQTTAAFSNWLSERFDMSVNDVELALGLSGFWESPHGELSMKIGEAEIGRPILETTIPKLSDLELSMKVGEQQWELHRLAVKVNESLVEGGAIVSTSDVLDSIKAMSAGSYDFQELLKVVTARVALKNWEFKNWLHLFPEQFRNSGKMDAALNLKPGLELDGHLKFSGFAIRPTQAYSTIDQIGGELELSKRKLTVKQASARVGGSPLAIKGWIDAEDLDDFLWDFSASGKRVPLVRTTDLILRSDVDLELQRLSADVVPKLSGELNFTQSTLLVEFDPMAPKVETGPGRPPPYFSITRPSIANWEFDVVGKGDSFFRVRSPYFRALLSANLELEGTFIKPELVGALRVASGDILFPSVRMELDAGEAFIEPTRPTEVQLGFSGIAQVSSYVITMEVEQTLSDPSVYFSSTPTLPNSEIIRLLATGGLSGGEVGAVGVYLGKGLLGIGAGGRDSSLANRLTIDVGESGGRDGGNTFGVKYRIADDLYLNGGYDIHEAYNLNLLWSIFKR